MRNIVQRNKSVFFCFLFTAFIWKDYVIFFPQYINTEPPRAGSKTDMARKNSLLTVKKNKQKKNIRGPQPICLRSSRLRDYEGEVGHQTRRGGDRTKVN